jgi:putative ABC transport system substrate-binding protein
MLSLAPSATEQGAAAARFIARILRGESPAGMPAEFPKLVELVLNLREADAIGIKVPFDLITDATKVIK